MTKTRRKLKIPAYCTKANSYSKWTNKTTINATSASVPQQDGD